MAHDPLHFGALIFPNMDQMDFTGPFEVLSTIPNSQFHIFWKDLSPVRDGHGLILTPNTTLAAAPPFDVLIVPGGTGQEALMDDEEVLGFLRTRAAQVRYVLSVCTGALLCGAAGLLRGRRAATHWNSFATLPYFGAIPVDERVVVDGNYISTAGVSSGIDGALRLAQLLRGDAMAQVIQLNMQYSPQLLFPGGTPATSPPAIVETARAAVQDLMDRRLATARRVAERLGVKTASQAF